MESSIRMDELEKIKERRLKELLGKMSQTTGSDNTPVKLTDSTFNEFIKRDSLVLVDFWAEWCGPCRMVAPTLEKLAAEYAGKVAIGKLNVDEYPNIAVSYGVSSIPTLMFFKGGKTVDVVIGAVPKPVIEGKIKELI